MTQQRHDSCFELLGSRQHGVAQHKAEQPTPVEWSTKCSDSGSDFGWPKFRHPFTS